MLKLYGWAHKNKFDIIRYLYFKCNISTWNHQLQELFEIFSVIDKPYFSTWNYDSLLMVIKILYSILKYWTE